MSDGTYLLNAGSLFFAVWSLGLVTFFVIVFGKDLFFAGQSRSNLAKKSRAAMRSIDYRKG